MKIHHHSPRAGIALIIVLLVIMSLGILAGGFAYSMKIETKLARNASHDVEMEWLGRSGVELAKYVLASEAIGPFAACDCLNQRWAGGMGDTNSAAASIPLDNFELGRGSISVKIVDLDRKLNINAADDVILRQALILVGVDAGDHATIVDSILDWRDPDESARSSGAESSDYASYQPPYYCKNGPFDDLTELLLIKGITPAMYWGASGAGAQFQVLNQPSFGRPSGFDEPAYAVGLADLFTTVSGRQMNVNTASATQLQVIPEIDENIAQSIIMTRAGPDGADGTEDDMPFRSVGELARVPNLNPMIAQQLGRFFTVRSLVFEVTVQARIDNDARTYISLLRRNNPRDIQLISFYWR